MSVRASLDRIRRHLREGERADLALAVAFLVGLASSTVHWSGLLVGGVLVGLVAPTLRRALLTGLYLGGSVLVAFGLYMWWLDALAAYTAMGMVFAASVGVSLGLPVLAAGAARGLT